MLELYHTYTRKEVHDIFAPQTKFIPRTGYWGLHGSVRIPDTDSYVFFVTLGSSPAGHDFDEAITADGVLTWQSKPSQSLTTPTIQKFIHHDPLTQDLHLFFRPSEPNLYYYLGRLAYLEHDPSRENPVYFKWQILDWNPPEEVAVQCRVAGYQPSPALDAAPPAAFTLEVISRPQATSKPSKVAAPPSKPHSIDFLQQYQNNLDLGAYGEDIILAYEKQGLMDCGRPDLAEQVFRTAEVFGNTTPYDIKSFTPEGAEKYIEVKTTRSRPETAFFLSAQEYAFYLAHRGSYYLYRLCRVNPKTRSGQLYIARDLGQDFSFQPRSYQVTPL